MLRWLRNLFEREEQVRHQKFDLAALEDHQAFDRAQLKQRQQFDRWAAVIENIRATEGVVRDRRHVNHGHTPERRHG